MKILAMFLLFQGAILIAGAILSSDSNNQQLIALATVKRAVKVPFTVLKDKDAQGYSLISATEEGINRALYGLETRLRNFGLLQGSAIVIGCLSLGEAAFIFQRRSKGNRPTAWRRKVGD